MDIHGTAGITISKMNVDLKGYGTVWYHSAGIAYTLSVARVSEKGHVVTYSSNNGNKFVLKKIDGTIRTFEQSPGGLFFLDTDKIVSESVFSNAVDNNKSNYTGKDYSQARLAHRIQRMIGRPSTQHFLHIVDDNLLKNFQINR